MKIDSTATKAARKSHAAGVKELHRIFGYDPLHPGRSQGGGGTKARARRAQVIARRKRP